LAEWARVQTVRRPSDDNDDVVLWRRLAPDTSPSQPSSHNPNRP
jgi:hypothetical protein